MNAAAKTRVGVELLRHLSNQPRVRLRLAKTQRLLDGMTPRTDTPPQLPPRQKVTRRLAPETIDQLLADYRAGSSTPQLAERYGISKTSVKRLLHDHGVAVRLRGLDDTDTERASELRSRGLSLEAIARKLGYSRKAVTTALSSRQASCSA